MWWTQLVVSEKVTKYLNIGPERSSCIYLVASAKRQSQKELGGSVVTRVVVSAKNSPIRG